MKKNNNFIKILIYLIILGVFFFFEGKLYQKYKTEKQMRDYIKDKNTTEIEEVFLLRKKGFYLDKEYLKEFKDLTEKSIEKMEE